MRLQQCGQNHPSTCSTAGRDPGQEPGPRCPSCALVGTLRFALGGGIKDARRSISSSRETRSSVVSSLHGVLSTTRNEPSQHSSNRGPPRGGRVMVLHTVPVLDDSAPCEGPSDHHPSVHGGPIGCRAARRPGDGAAGEGLSPSRATPRPLAECLLALDRGGLDEVQGVVVVLVACAALLGAEALLGEPALHALGLEEGDLLDRGGGGGLRRGRSARHRSCDLRRSPRQGRLPLSPASM
jgi:hypothetical protein